MKSFTVTQSLEKTSNKRCLLFFQNEVVILFFYIFNMIVYLNTEVNSAVGFNQTRK